MEDVAIFYNKVSKLLSTATSIYKQAQDVFKLYKALSSRDDSLKDVLFDLADIINESYEQAKTFCHQMEDNFEHLVFVARKEVSDAYHAIVRMKNKIF